MVKVIHGRPCDYMAKTVSGYILRLLSVKTTTVRCSENQTLESAETLTPSLNHYSELWWKIVFKNQDSNNEKFKRIALF